jgi:hypothetical protein
VVIDWKEVADRIRGLVNLDDDGRLPVIAERLRVDEGILRQAVMGTSQPAYLTLVAAIIRVYGLDPSWVLTGRYDEGTHRVALRGDPREIGSIVLAMSEAPRAQAHAAATVRQH